MEGWPIILLTGLLAGSYPALYLSSFQPARILKGKIQIGKSALAIFITGLGLFGMAAFTAEQRRKEIGIRKVMGASVLELVMMLSMDFSKLVVLAFAIVAPLAWWMAHDFLQQYQVRIKMPLWVFPMAGGTALIITVLIVSTQALRAATSNPVNALSSE